MWVLFVLLLGFPCASAPPEGAPVAPPLRVQIAEIAKPACGKCHQSTLDTAKPAALAVFDLDQPAWPDTMSDEQIEEFRRRLSDGLDDDQLGALDAFVNSEIGD